MSVKPVPAIPPVVKTVVVPCSTEEAFRFFTADFGKWWPSASHSVVAFASGFEDKPAEVVLESHVGGRILERTRSGEEHLWGTVKVWDPPTKLAFSFHPGREADSGQIVEIAFSPTAGGTAVILTHSGWEHLGDGGEAERNGYNDGWEPVFVKAFAEHVAQAR